MTSLISALHVTFRGGFSWQSGESPNLSFHLYTWRASRHMAPPACPAQPPSACSTGSPVVAAATVAVTATTSEEPGLCKLQSPQMPAESRSGCTWFSRRGETRRELCLYPWLMITPSGGRQWLKLCGGTAKGRRSGREGRDRQENTEAGQGGRREKTKEQRPWNFDSITSSTPWPLRSLTYKMVRQNTFTQQSSSMSLRKKERTNDVLKGYHYHCSGCNLHIYNVYRIDKFSVLPTVKS